MTQSVTFLHMADVHFGAPMRGFASLTDEWATKLAHAISESFERAIDAALAHRVDFVVIAGDMFDTSRGSYAEYLEFFDALNKLDEAGIPTYLVAGNHDPYTTWVRDIDRLPPAARFLGIDGPEAAEFTRPGDASPVCTIIGRSYYNQTWPADRRIAEGISRVGVRSPFAIGVVHTGLDIDLNKAPATEGELLSAGLDYWACGHLHQRFARPNEGDPRIVFPGCVQARNVKETGERGCYLVKLAEGAAPKLEFIPTSSVVFESLHVDVGVCQTLGDLVRLVASELFRKNGQAHCDEMVTRIALTGATDLHRFLIKPEVIEDLRKQINDAYPSFYCDALEDRTVPVSQSAGQRTAHPFGAIIAEMADEQREREETMVNYVQNEFVKRGIPVPDSLSRRVGAFNDAAETLVFDLLRDEEE